MSTEDISYELCYDPRDANVLIYRSSRAGICGPFSEQLTCESREDAERFACGRGYMISGDWESHTNYDSAPLVRMSLTTEELKETEAAYKVASEQAEQLRSRRNELVLQALADGLTHAQISEISGLSRGRIGQIAQTGEKK